MAGRLESKIAVITAAGQGIGRSSALLFAREGASVWALDINKSMLDSLAAEAPGIRTMVLDVTDPAAIKTFAGQVGDVDILFNCAGFVHEGTILECEESDWDRSFDINVRSMYRMIRALLPRMIERRKGSIVNMSSLASSVKGVPNRFVYGATKAAVIGLSKAVAVDVLTKGIRVNTICPATVDSPSLRARIQASADPVAARAAFESRQPMGRLGAPEEIANLALYLASDESSYTTGGVHVIDGGWMA
jgi:2-keto-3-deoxy-L-fuconate dehydrogenase